MTQLLTLYTPSILANGADLTFHCWPCDRAHTFASADVERLVYTLAAEVAELQTSAPISPAMASLPCLAELLDRATTGDHFQFVDLTVDRREGDPDPVEAESADA